MDAVPVHHRSPFIDGCGQAAAISVPARFLASATDCLVIARVEDWTCLLAVMPVSRAYVIHYLVLMVADGGGLGRSRKRVVLFAGALPPIAVRTPA
jgi:hypothetical protein